MTTKTDAGRTGLLMALVTAMADRNYKNIENIARRLGAREGLGAYAERVTAQEHNVDGRP